MGLVAVAVKIHLKWETTLLDILTNSAGKICLPRRVVTEANKTRAEDEYYIVETQLSKLTVRMNSYECDVEIGCRQTSRGPAWI